MAEVLAVPDKPRVLFVDDEQPVLDRLTSNLRKAFDIVTATSGDEGLDRLRSDPNILVVVSDMQMPHMNGASFLTRARESAPDVVRMLLTGGSDLESAAAAVNSGQIFRFLTKPCPRDELRAAVETALEHRRLQQVERELLDQTLRGSIRILVDMLALANPGAFGRANRIKTSVLELAAELGITETWQLEIAAQASQLGYIALPRELCEKLEQGRSLTSDERRIVTRAPETTATLLAHIPRLEGVCEMLARHVKPPKRNPAATGQARIVELGAHILRFALDFDEVEASSPARAIDTMRARASNYDAEIAQAFERVQATRLARVGIKEIPVSALRVGMLFADDVRLASNALLVARGYEVTPGFIERIRNFPPGTVREPLRISIL